MASITRLVVLCALALAVTAFVVQPEEDTCGYVSDGLAYGQYDLRTQTSRTTLAAHWDGFSDDVLIYEYAVVSADLMPFLHKKRMHCSVFAAEPNVVAWTNVRNANSAVLNNMDLTVGESYHFLVRATFRSGRQGVVATDGVLVTEREDPIIESDANSKGKRGIRVERATANVQQVLSTSSSECSIDAENRCRASRVSVGEYLQETYGDPVFDVPSSYNRQVLIGTDAARARAGIFEDNGATRQLQRDFEGVGLIVDTEDYANYADSNGDDDDNGGGGLGPGEAPLWALAPVLVAALLCVVIGIILVIVRVALRGAGGGGGGGGQTSSYGSSLAGDIDESKDYSQRKGANVGAADDRTAVSFPDMQIRRLSITHEGGDGEGDLLEEATKSPRRKHPIMSTQSSSTRNYQDDA